MERILTPKEEVARVVNQLAAPWLNIGECPPVFSPKQVARSLKITEGDVKSIIDRGLALPLIADAPMQAILDQGPKGKLRIRVIPFEKQRTKRTLKDFDYSKSTEKSEAFMAWVNSVAVAPPQRPGRIRELTTQAVCANNAFYLLNWICPPGTPLEFDSESGQLYRRYVGIDPEQGFQKDYRLAPRIPLEKRQLEQFERLSIPYLYLKLTANDNPYCLYPPCLRIDGEQATQQSISGFTDFTQSKLDQLIGPNQVYVTSMSDVLGPIPFKQMVQLYNEIKYEDLAPYLPSNTLQTELEVLSKHTQIDDRLRPFLPTLAKDVVRQYAVEGYIIYEVFGDNVVLSWNESTRRASIIDSLRKLKGLPPFPKIFVLYERSNGRILNNF